MTAPSVAGRLARRRIDGVLLLDKPSGLTSNAALQRAKRIYRAEKAGQTSAQLLSRFREPLFEA